MPYTGPKDGCVAGVDQSIGKPDEFGSVMVDGPSLLSRTGVVPVISWRTAPARTEAVAWAMYRPRQMTRAAIAATHNHGFFMCATGASQARSNAVWCITRAGPAHAHRPSRAARFWRAPGGR